MFPQREKGNHKILDNHLKMVKADSLEMIVLPQQILNSRVI